MTISKKSFAFLLCTLLALVLTASVCAASVQIPRNDGTLLPLSQISDIVRHVTGNLASKDVFFPKNSLMMIRAGKNGSNVEITPSIVTFYKEGSTYGIFDTKSGAKTTEGISNLNWNYIPGIHSAVLSTATIDGQKTTIASIPASPSNQLLYSVSTSRTDTANDTRYNFNFVNSKSTLAQQAFALDSRGGITVKDFDGELCAEVYCSNTSDGLVTLMFSSVKKSELSDLDIESINNLSWSKNFKPVKVGAGNNFSYYLPASLTVGDFDGDGYKNEIALITADVDKVYFSVFKISYSNGTFTRTALKDNETLYTFQVSEERRNAVRNGLWGGIPSVCVTAADFDLDGKDELVALFTDDVKEYYKSKEEVWEPGYYYYDDETKEEANISYYNFIADKGAITSGLKMASYKWDGSNLSSAGSRAIQYYDEFVYNSFAFANTAVVDVKAVAADWDGDGKKSLVIMRTEFSPADKESWPRLYFYDWTGGDWNFSKNNEIELGLDDSGDYLETFSYKDGTNYDKVKYSFNYPVFAHNYSIAAGPFTGEIGKVFPTDNFIIQYLANDREAETTGCKKVKLLHNFKLDPFSPYTKRYACDYQELLKITNNDFWNAEFDMIGLAAADFASEGAEIGTPIKVVTPASRNNYLAILQAPPYHVDTLTADGRALQKEPRNFTYRNGTKVSYSNSSTTTSKDIVKFNMTKSVETIFALDNGNLSDKELQDDIGSIRSITGSVSSVLDNDLIGKIPGADDVKKKFSSVSGFINNLFDKVETTTNKTNEHTATTDINITTAASLKDVLYLAASDQYIWRYPVLTNPAPAWLTGDNNALSADFGSAKIENQDTYITFVVDDTPNRRSIYGHDDAGYQPFRELGNLFSYPSALEEVQGYENRTRLIDVHEWGGPLFDQRLKLTKTNETHTVTSSKVKKGMITEFLSIIDSLAGADKYNSMAKVPSVPDPKDFTRTTSNSEEISITLPNALDGAGYHTLFEGYLDAGGAMTMAFAVNQLNRDDAIWGTRSLYSTKPDPALLLSQKFIIPNDSDKFIGNDNDPTALKIGGVRISVPYYGKDSSNLLVKNLEYNFEVPVYNASFVTARNVKLRLSYANMNSYNGVENFNKVKRTTITETTLETLPGWGSGNRVMAKFAWTPTVNTGNYYLFVEIDPDNKIAEVHENRRNAKGSIVDYGGNNLGYFPVYIADANAQIYDRDKIRTQTSGIMTADKADDLDYLYEHTDMKLNGTSDLSEFWDLLESNDYGNEPAVIEAEITYNGEYLVPSVMLTGAKYKDSSLSAYIGSGGEYEMTDEDFETYFLNKKLSLIPGQSQTIHFLIDDPYMLMTSEFSLELPDTEIDKFNATNNDPEQNPDNNNQSNNSVLSSSSGGCDSGFSVAGLGIMLAALMLRRKVLSGK